MFTDEQIARVFHTALRMHQANNDPTVAPPWNDLPDADKDSLIEEVTRTRGHHQPGAPFSQMAPHDRLFHQIVVALEGI